MALDPNTGEEIKVDDHAADDLDNQRDKETVPVSVVQGIREELNQVKGELQSTKDQLRLYQMNTTQNQEGSTEKKSTETGALAGMEDDDVITVAEAKKLIVDLKNDMNTLIGELKVSSVTPDYQEVITKHLPKVIQANPALARAIKTSENPYLVAYELAKTDPEYIQEQTEKAAQNANQKIDENLKKPGSASAAGGGGGGLSQADMYAKMTDKELEDKISDVKKRG